MVWRNIQRNHSASIPRRIVFLDTETIKEPIDGHKLRFNNYLRLGVAISCRLEKQKQTRRHVFHFDESDRFWEWMEYVTGPQYTTWLVCHKSSFDMGVVGLWRELDEGRIILDSPREKRPILNENECDARSRRALCVFEDPPFILGLQMKNGGRIVVVDTLNWFRCPLAELGDSMGLAKLEMPSAVAAATDWKAYCLRDVEIVERSFLTLVDFVQSNDFGMFRYTAPSQAMAIYRHKYMTHNVNMNDDWNAKPLERKAYYGGDTRCFWIGKIHERIYQLDVNGLYPFIMQQCSFPCRLLSKNESGQQILVKPWPEVNRCIATVEIKSDVREYPYKDEIGTCYCTGNFITSLCGPELEFAYQAGDIVRFIDWAYYKTVPLFAGYVAAIHELRCQYRETHNRPFEMLCKLLLNSLYGKFGQRSYRWEHRPDMIAVDRWSRWLEVNAKTRHADTCLSIGNEVFKSSEPEEHANSFPGIAAFVTSNARQYMRYIRSVIGMEHCYYQATDSLIIDSEGLLTAACEGLVHENELGKMKIVAEGKDGEIRGINWYRIGKKEIHSGLRSTAKPLGESHWYQELFENAESQIARKPTNTIQSWETIFTARQNYRRGYVTGSQRVRPLHVLRAV